MKKLLVQIGVVLLGWSLCVWGQFGGVQQPIFSKTQVSSATALPTNGYLKHNWLASSCPQGAVAGWTDVVSGLVMSQATEANRPTNVNGGIYFPNASSSDTKSLDMTFGFPVNQAMLIVSSNLSPTATDPNNHGLFLVRSIGSGLRLMDRDGAVTWKWNTDNTEAGGEVLANYGASMPSGIQSILIFETDRNAAYTNGALSVTNITAPAIPSTTYQLGRGSIWSGASSFGGYILEIAIWTNSPVMTEADIQAIFEYVDWAYP